VTAAALMFTAAAVGHLRRRSAPGAPALPSGLEGRLA
jgi:hypothetical protein